MGVGAVMRVGLSVRHVRACQTQLNYLHYSTTHFPLLTLTSPCPPLLPPKMENLAPDVSLVWKLMKGGLSAAAKTDLMSRMDQILQKLASFRDALTDVSINLEGLAVQVSWSLNIFRTECHP